MNDVPAGDNGAARATDDSGTRPLGFGSLLALGINGVVGVGIFFTPSTVAARAPAGRGVAVFALTAALMAPVALSFVRLARRFADDGGPVLYARAAFARLPAFAVGWIAYVSAVASTASTCAGFSQAMLGTTASSLAVRGLSVALVTVLAAICAIGIVPSARIWSFLTVAKLLPLVAFVALSYAIAPHVTGLPAAGSAVGEGGSWREAALLATFAFQGFEIVPVVAGQARASSRVVPAALLGALGGSALLYIAIQAACEKALGIGLADAREPLVAAASVYGGRPLAEALGWAMRLSALGIAFAMVAMTPRYLASLAEGARLAFDLHRGLARGVPLRALVVTWALVAVLVGTFGANLETLLKLSSVAVLCQYASAALALATLGLRARLGFTRRDAYFAVPALAVSAWIASGAEPIEWLTAVIALALGLALRALSARLVKA